MKKFVSISFLLSLTLIAMGQQDTIVIFYDISWKKTSPENAAYYTVAFPKDNLWRRLDFFADNDKLQMEGYYEDRNLEIKTGPFKYYYNNGQVSSKGYYKKNNKVGRWLGWSGNNQMTDSSFYNEQGIYSETSVRWYDSGQVSDSIICDEKGNGTYISFWTDKKRKGYGQLKEGKKSGKWIYNSSSGFICQEVFYETDSAVSYTCYDETGDVQIKDCVYERDAEFKGGQGKWIDYLRNAMTRHLPREYFKGSLAGKVVVDFIIDKDGKVTNAKISYSTEPLLNESALKIINSSPKWIPAIQYNRPVNAYRKQPLTFTRAE